MSWRKGNPGSNHSTLWTRTALSPASLGWQHPHQPILRPATKVVFPKRKQEHTTPSAYNPWAALCCPLDKPILSLWWWVAACLSSPFPRPQPQLTLGSSPSMHFLPTPGRKLVSAQNAGPQLVCWAYSYSAFQTLLGCVSSEERKMKRILIQDWS